MMQRARISSGSTSAVLWLMILLVFLPIAVGHLVARRSADDGSRSGAVREQALPRAG